MRRKIAMVARTQLGLVARDHLLSLGLNDDAIGHRLASGELERVHPGVYRLPGYPSWWDQRLMAALLATGGASAISFQAAGMVWALDRVRTDVPHVTVVHAQRVELSEFVVHRTRLFAPGDVIRRGPLRVTSPYRTILDLAGVLPADALEDALDDAIRKRLVSVKALTKRLEIRGRRGVRGIGRLAKLLEDRTDAPKKASSLQNRVRRGIAAAKLPTPLEEHPIYDSSGRFVARVDFAYPERKIYIEVDGSHHETKKQRDDDRARQNRLARAGWTPLRYDRDQVNARIYLVEIEEILRSGEDRPTAMSGDPPQNERDVRT